MRDLSTLRNGWDEIEVEETLQLREMTIAESLHIFSVLYESFKARFLAEESTYLIEREADLIEQHRRLVRLAEWLTEHPGESPLSITRQTPETLN